MGRRKEMPVSGLPQVKACVGSECLGGVEQFDSRLMRDIKRDKEGDMRECF